MKRVYYRPALFVCVGLLSAAGCAKNDFVKKDEMVPPAAVTKQAQNSSAKPVTDEGQLNGRQAKEERPSSTIGSAGQLKDALGSIYFTLDSSDLDSSARETLASTYESLKQQPGIKIRVEGNCDERGSAEYNLALGEKRAKAARKYLTAMGIADSRLSTISYGKEKPVDPSHHEAAWKKNRRDDFAIVSE
jgi:peptidoglycan-associated lipoprotein